MKHRERTGQLLTPSALLALAPFELLALFTTAAGDDGEIDPVAELTRTNRERAAKGLQPAVPSWLMPQVPRRRRSTQTAPRRHHHVGCSTQTPA